MEENSKPGLTKDDARQERRNTLGLFTVLGNLQIQMKVGGETL